MAESADTPKPELWAVTANVVKQRLYGEHKEPKNGTRLFSGGAKVYVVASFPGMAENVIAIGHHRGSKKYVHTIINVALIENLRLSLIYSPKVHEIASNISENGAWVSTSKEHAEHLLKLIPEWQAYNEN